MYYFQNSLWKPVFQLNILLSWTTRIILTFPKRLLLNLCNLNLMNSWCLKIFFDASQGLALTIVKEVVEDTSWLEPINYKLMLLELRKFYSNTSAWREACLYHVKNILNCYSLWTKTCIIASLSSSLRTQLLIRKHSVLVICVCTITETVLAFRKVFLWLFKKLWLFTYRTADVSPTHR